MEERRGRRMRWKAREEEHHLDLLPSPPPEKFPSYATTDEYAPFTVKHYGKATVVFDGYSVGPSTKDSTHQQKGKIVTVIK